MTSLHRRPSGPGRYDRSSHGEWIEDRGLVVQLFANDGEDDHQRFVVRLATGQTLLIAHNLELAARIPLGIGDRVSFRGVYEWNGRGGAVHWTHHDPHGGDEAGFVRLRDTVYA